MGLIVFARVQVNGRKFLIRAARNRTAKPRYRANVFDSRHKLVGWAFGSTHERAVRRAERNLRARKAA